MYPSNMLHDVDGIKCIHSFALTIPGTQIRKSMSSSEQNIMHVETDQPRNTRLNTDSSGSGYSLASVNDSGYDPMHQHVATFTFGEESPSSDSLRSDVMLEEDSDIENDNVFGNDNEIIQPSQMTHLPGGEDTHQNRDLRNELQTVSSPINIPARNTSGLNYQHAHSDPLFGARCEPRGLVQSYEAVSRRCHASSQTEDNRNHLGLKLHMAPRRQRSNTIAHHDFGKLIASFDLTEILLIFYSSFLQY